MAAIASNGTGGGNWSVGASWTGGIAPVAGDTVTIANGDLITADTTGLACKSIALNGTLSASRTASSTLTVGDHTSDTLITWGANGFLDYGTSASPIPAAYVAKLILDPLTASASASQSNLTMTSCTGATKGFSVVGAASYAGIALSYTNPFSNTVYTTRRAWTTISAQVSSAQANVVLTEDLNVPAGTDFAVLGSHASSNSQVTQGEVKNALSYTPGTKTIVATANFANNHVLNPITGVTATECRAYTRASNAIIQATSGKYFGFIAPTSNNPIFDLQNCTLDRFYGNTNQFTILEGKVFQGVVILGPASQSPQGFRANNPITFVGCVFDGFCNQNTNSYQYLKCLGTVTDRVNVDPIQVNTAAYVYDSVFQDCSQPLVNSNGVYSIRNNFVQCTNCHSVTGGVYSEDCTFQAVNNTYDSASAGIIIRPVFGRRQNGIGGSSAGVYVESPVFAVAASTDYGGINNATASVGNNYGAAMQTPSGASAPTTVGITYYPGGTITGFTTGTVPDAVTPAPSGASIYNRVVTQAAAAPSATNRPFRAVRIKHQVNVVSGQGYAFTVNLRTLTNYTASALTSVQIRLTLPGSSTSIITTISSLTTGSWQPFSVAGTPAASGAATIEVYIQANIGTLYVDFPLDMDPGGYRWTNGTPQVAQTRLADSSSGVIALAVWNAALGGHSSGTKGYLIEKLLTESVFLEELAA